MNDLLPPDMSDMKVKLEGYKLTEMNFFELTTILEYEFTKAFTELRLIILKKYLMQSSKILLHNMIL